MFPTRPDFLVISPPKTGTTWLADNCRHHPSIFIPNIKEVKYFSSLHRVLDLDWYLSHFAPAENRRAGEVSPSYAALPVAMIRRVRDYFPHLKLVFLMRDPVARAWSHAKHAHQYREITFADRAPGPATDEEWRTVLADSWSLLSGDYLGQLRRWTSIFPPEQMFIGFYDDIMTRPADLLRRIFHFLGVDVDIDLTSFPLHERILPGVGGEPSLELGAFLRGLLGPRTVELVDFLQARFGLHPPAEWQIPSYPESTWPTSKPEAFARDTDDAFVAAVAACEDDFPTAFRDVHRDYRDYDLVYYRGRLLAVDQAACGSAIPGADHATLNQLIAAGKCLVADSLPALKELVIDRILNRMERRFAAVEAKIKESQAVAERTTADLTRVILRLQHGTWTERVERRVRRFANRIMFWTATGPVAG